LSFHSLVHQNNPNSISDLLQYLIAADLNMVLVEVTELSAFL